MGTNTQILTQTNDICIEGLLDDMYVLSQQCNGVSKAKIAHCMPLQLKFTVKL